MRKSDLAESRLRSAGLVAFIGIPIGTMLFLLIITKFLGVDINGRAADQENIYSIIIAFVFAIAMFCVALMKITYLLIAVNIAKERGITFSDARIYMLDEMKKRV